MIIDTTQKKTHWMNLLRYVLCNGNNKTAMEKKDVQEFRLKYIH